MHPTNHPLTAATRHRRTAPAPHRPRRRATGRWAALAVVLALGAAGCGDDSVDAPAPGDAPAVTASSTSPAASPTSDGGLSADDAEQAVRAWLAAARDADVPGMTDLLGPSSVAAAEGLGGLDSLASGLAEGVAAFADAQDWTVAEVPGHPDARLVVASGEVTREGMTERDARAWFAHRLDGRVVVEAFTGVVPEVVRPLPGQPHRADAAVEVVLPAAGDDATLLVLADGEDVTATATAEGADGDRVRVSVPAPAGGWAADGHVVAVGLAPADPGGPWPATAVSFSVD
ncbi:hypothetical protein [Thalassiella azotivora]